MILAILMKKITLYVFGAGFALNFIIFSLRSFPVLNIFVASVVGGFVFCGVWYAILNGLLFLLGEKDMSEFFQVPLDTPNSPSVSFSDEDGEAVNVYTDDADDDLTVGDLYGFQGSNDDSNDEYQSSNNDYHWQSSSDADDGVSVDVSNGTDLLSDQVNKDFKLDATGHFNLTANGKSLKVSPKDGANAIKKVLNDDKK